MLTNRLTTADQQGKRDLNPQPAVLETAALPIELLPFVVTMDSRYMPKGMEQRVLATKNQIVRVMAGRVEPTPSLGQCTRIPGVAPESGLNKKMPGVVDSSA